MARAWLSEEKVALRSQGMPIFHSGSSFLKTETARKAEDQWIEWVQLPVWASLFVDFKALELACDV